MSAVASFRYKSLYSLIARVFSDLEIVYPPCVFFELVLGDTKVFPQLQSQRAVMKQIAIGVGEFLLNFLIRRGELLDHAFAFLRNVERLVEQRLQGRDPARQQAELQGPIGGGLCQLALKIDGLVLDGAEQ